MRGERYDLAIVGAGIAGTYIGDRLKQARPRSSIAVFERTDRIGGRLRSVPVAGLDHPIELGGMRFMSAHQRVASIVDDFGLPTHPFDRTAGPERAFLRGVVARGPTDPAGAKNYRLDANEQGQSALELWQRGFERIVPNSERLEHEDFVRLRATGEYLGRRVTDWSIGDVLRSSLSPEGWEYVHHAFGYDSGIRAFNATDFVEFLQSGGDPTAVARTPDDGRPQISGSQSTAQTAASWSRALIQSHLESGSPGPLSPKSGPLDRRRMPDRARKSDRPGDDRRRSAAGSTSLQSRPLAR